MLLQAPHPAGPCTHIVAHPPHAPSSSRVTWSSRASFTPTTWYRPERCDSQCLKVVSSKCCARIQKVKGSTLCPSDGWGVTSSCCTPCSTSHSSVGSMVHSYTRTHAKRDSEAFPLQRAKLTLPGVALCTHPGVQWECLVLFDGGAHGRQCRTVLKQRKRLVWSPDACIRRANHCWRNRSNNRLDLRHRSRRKNGSVRRAAAEQQAPPMPAPHWSHPQCLIRV